MKLVICDWNGTLIIDGFAWIFTHQEYCRQSGCAIPDFSELSEIIFGADNHDVLGRLSEFYAARGINVDWKEELPFFKKLYEKYSASASLHPLAKSTIKSLLQRRKHVHLLSASKAHDAQPHIERHDIHSLLGNENITLEREDKPKAIHEILDQHGVDAHEACMIGDTAGDIYSAKEAGITSIGIITSHVPKNAIESAEPDYLVRCLSELIQIADGHKLPDR